MNSRQNKIENAKHNKRACEHIGKVTSFPDWMITTAFYSAIHYVDSRIFPIEITTKDGKRIQCSSLDIYYTLQKNISPDVPPKHEIRKKLAREKLDSDISACFQRLSDASSTARYVNYKGYTFRQAQELYNDLCAIEAYCVQENKVPSPV